MGEVKRALCCYGNKICDLLSFTVITSGSAVLKPRLTAALKSEFWTVKKFLGQNKQLKHLFFHLYSVFHNGSTVYQLGHKLFLSDMSPYHSILSDICVKCVIITV